MPNILLVDDDIELTELLSELLSLEGFNVHIVHNGKEALEQVSTNQYDLVLLDVMMPVLNGIETLKQLRQAYTIPVLILSARNDEIDKVIGLELGADDYLPKPFNDRELVARIKAILRRSIQISHPIDTSASSAIRMPEKEHKQIIYFSGIELHTGRQLAIYQGAELELTGTEFMLLEMLVRNAGKILSREMLSMDILGKPLTPYDRAIDMHMSNLRKKLPERSDNLPWFKTLRGRGYLLLSEQ